METTTLEYYQVILQKVHFHPPLFRKEYYKSLRQLSHPERVALRQWLATTFGPSVQSLLSQNAVTRSSNHPVRYEYAS